MRLVPSLGLLNTVTHLFFSLFFAFSPNTWCLLFMLIRTGFQASWNFCFFLFFRYRIEHHYLENSYLPNRKHADLYVLLQVGFSLTAHLKSMLVLFVYSCTKCFHLLIYTKTKVSSSPLFSELQNQVEIHKYSMY